MQIRVLLVLSPAFERPDARVPLVVATQAVAGSSDAERWIAPREIGLRVDDLHDGVGLRSLHVADEWPQEMQPKLNVSHSANTPATIWPPVPSTRPDPRDRAQVAERGLQPNEFGRDPDGSGTNGFFNHRTDTECNRMAWSMVLGQAVRKPQVIERVIRQVDMAPTIARWMGLEVERGSGVILPEIHG